MKWLRKWWRAYVQACRLEIAASKKRKRRSWLPPDNYMSRINPATGLPMVGLVDVAGNPYGSSGDTSQEWSSCDSTGSPDVSSPNFTIPDSDLPSRASSGHDMDYCSMNRD